MTDTPWTPGPWMVGGARSTVVYATRPTNLRIADTDGVGWEEARANARLLAAAPELVEALRAADLMGDHPPAIEQKIRAALRAAGHPDYQENNRA